MALDPAFDADSMAKALGIPSNKHMLHRHLYEEMKTLSVSHRLLHKLKTIHANNILVSQIHQFYVLGLSFDTAIQSRAVPRHHL